jgi:hypothetical protein
MVVVFDMGVLEFGYTRAMSCMFTGTQEDQALCMVITTGYGASILGTVWSQGLHLYMDRQKPNIMVKDSNQYCLPVLLGWSTSDCVVAFECVLIWQKDICELRRLVQRLGGQVWFQSRPTYPSDDMLGINACSVPAAFPPSSLIVFPFIISSSVLLTSTSSAYASTLLTGRCLDKKLRQVQ